MRDMRGSAEAASPPKEDMAKSKRSMTAEEASDAEELPRPRADSEVEPEAKRQRSTDVDVLIPAEQRGVPCTCRHCDGVFGSRNMLFKHLKDFGLEKHDPIGSVGVAAQH